MFSEHNQMMEQRSQRCFLDMQHCLTFNHLCCSVVSELSMISDCFEREETLPGVQMSVTESSWLLNSINSLSSRVQLVSEASQREGLSHQANVILKWLHSNKFISIYSDLIPLNTSFTATKMKETMSMGNFCQKDTAKIHNKVMRVGL